jgi:hypothetical protein
MALHPRPACPHHIQETHHNVQFLVSMVDAQGQHGIRMPKLAISLFRIWDGCFCHGHQELQRPSASPSTSDTRLHQHQFLGSNKGCTIQVLELQNAKHGTILSSSIADHMVWYKGIATCKSVAAGKRTYVLYKRLLDSHALHTTAATKRTHDVARFAFTP